MKIEVALSLLLAAIGLAENPAQNQNRAEDGAAAATESLSVEEEALMEVVESIEETTRAKSIRRDRPRYPGSEARKGREAWVHVTYCIDESGATQNVSILDSTGDGDFEVAAINTVKKWAYEPALREGTPVWQSRNDVYISFALEGNGKGASKDFILSYRRMARLIDEGDLQKADALFKKLYDDSDLSLYELGKLWVQRVKMEASSGDYYRLHMALTRATASGGKWIERESYASLLNLRTRTELQLGKYHEALRSYRRLVKATSETDERVVALQAAMDRLKSMIDGEQILKIPAEIRSLGDCAFCNDSWNFTPVRRNFSLSSIRGALTSIDMRCDNKRFETIVSDQVAWHIPEEWGTCRVKIYGEPGTKFDVLMLPPTGD